MKQRDGKIDGKVRKWIYLLVSLSAMFELMSML